jgi:hypothetical protein
MVMATKALPLHITVIITNQSIGIILNLRRVVRGSSISLIGILTPEIK